MTWFRNFRSSVHDIYSCDLLQQAITALYAKILIILGEKQMMEENKKPNMSLQVCLCPSPMPSQWIFQWSSLNISTFSSSLEVSVISASSISNFSQKSKVRSPKKVLCEIVLVRFYARLIRKKQGNSTAHEEFLLHETMPRNGVHHTANSHVFLWSVFTH